MTTQLQLINIIIMIIYTAKFKVKTFFCPYSLFICFVRFLRETASMYAQQFRIVFFMEVHCIVCEVWSKYVCVECGFVLVFWGVIFILFCIVIFHGFSSQLP